MNRATLVIFLLSFASHAAGKEPRSAQEYLKRGTSRYAAANYSGAIEDFSTAIRLNSHIQLKVSTQDGSLLHGRVMVMDRFNAVACFKRGIARIRTGDLVGAIQDFDNTISANPNDSTTLNSRGLAYLELQNTQRAARDFERAIQLDDHDFSAHNNLGILRYSSGDFVAAVAEFDRALLIRPRAASILLNRGSSLAVLGRLEEAISDFTSALQLDPSLLPAYRNRGLARMRQGRRAEAALDFARYRERGGNETDLSINPVP
jgi:tetratricopeptide (TPR) repeat protein